MAEIDEEPQFDTVKCVAIGSSGVGITRLLYSYTHNGWPKGYKPSVILNPTVSLLVDGKFVSLLLVDSSGQGDYDKLRPLFYPQTDVFLLCFSITDPASLEDIKEQWHPEIAHHCPGVPVVVVGTKLDARNNEKEIEKLRRANTSPTTYEQGLKMSREIGAVKYCECSAKTMEGVKAVFDEATRHVLYSDQGERLAYYRGMSEGYVYLTKKKLVLMGPPRVGKTAFKSLLFNWPAPRDHHSTPIASRPIRAIERVTDRNEGKVWDLVESKEVFRMLADAIEDVLDNPTPFSVESQLPNFENSLAPLAPVPLSSDNDTTDSNTVSENPKLSTETTEKIDSDTLRAKPTTHEYSEAVIHLLEKRKRKSKRSKELHKATWIHVLDSGGQPQFADISRAFLRGNALNVIVIKLTEKLSDKPQFAYSLNGRMINAPSELAMTNIQLIEHFVRSVAASKSTTVRIGDKEIVTKPFFIVIGTYYDQAMKGFISKKEVISESIADKNHQILSVLQEFRDHLIFYNDASDELIFPVDNFCWLNRKKISAQIRERIMSQEGVGFQVPIPVRWYIFELHIRELASTDEHGIVSLQSCYEKGNKLNMYPSEVKASLKYLDSLTLCLYYDKLLPNVIFTNPQYLLDLLSNLVRVSFVNVLDEILPTGRLLSPDTQKLLREDGVFEASLFDVLGLPFIPPVFTEDDFLKLLQYLNVIAPLTSSDSVQRYYMPVVLSPDQLHLTDDDKQVFMSTCDPIIIEFKMKLVPQGIFPSLVVSLVGRKEKPLFFIDSRSSTFPRQLRYAVKLYSNDLFGSVLLLDRFKYIEIYFTGFPTGCPALYGAIREAIVSCGQLLGYDETQLETNVTLSCQRAHRLTQTPHALKVIQYNGQSYSSCTAETELPPLPLTERQLCWLKNPSTPSVPPVPAAAAVLPDEILNEAHAPVILSVLTNLVGEWEILGIHLGLENSVLQEIKYTSLRQVEICRKEMIERWLRRGTATCQELLSALRIMNRGDVITKIQSLLVNDASTPSVPPVPVAAAVHVLPDGILNEAHVPVILSALTDLVADWEILGVHLKLEDSVLQRIKYNNSNEIEICRKEMIVKWLQGGTATCEELISALRILRRGDIIAKLQTE